MHLRASNTVSARQNEKGMKETVPSCCKASSVPLTLVVEAPGLQPKSHKQLHRGSAIATPSIFRLQHSNNLAKLTAPPLFLNRHLWLPSSFLSPPLLSLVNNLAWSPSEKAPSIRWKQLFLLVPLVHHWRHHRVWLCSCIFSFNFKRKSSGEIL